LNKLDRIQAIRNPFVHLKALNHPNIMTRRMLAQRTALDELSNQEAQEALSLMFSIGHFAKMR
jgi:hypothetical protein